MTSRERVLRAIRRQEVDRAPWVPFVGAHAASLVDSTVREYLHDQTLMLDGIGRAVERYRPDGIPVLFDLQLEAEALGCQLAWADDNPPAVSHHPLANGTTLAELVVPGPDTGRIPLALSTARALRAAHPDLALYGLVTGPFTLALHLMGTDIFTEMFENPDRLRAVMEFTRDVSLRMADLYIDAGCDVVAVVDPMTSQIGPDTFVAWVTPAVRPVFDHVRARGVAGSFFVCGHAQQNVEAMCECAPDNISVDENIPLAFVRDVCLPRGVSFGGNMQLTTVLLLGTPADARRNAIACLETAGTTGFVLSPGCDLPYAVPPANLEAVIGVVEDPYQREIAKAVAADAVAGPHLDMSEYGEADRVIVDVITLDSEACAPCQYMVDAVKRVAPEFEGIVEWREHKIKYRESLVFMTSLMVRNVPTICIDGRITFVSRIPPRDDLIAAIQRRINEKLRTKIARRRGALYILGADGPEAAEIGRRAQLAITELGAEIGVQAITDAESIRSYGIAPVQTPAVVVARYQLKSTRTAPEVAAIKEWIKDLS